MDFWLKKLIFVLGFWGTNSLDPYQLYSDGSCANIHIQPVRNFDRLALDSMRYISAGSRYNLYRVASSHPLYDSITPEELRSEMCIQRNTTTLRPGTVGALTGFGGRLLLTHDVVPPRGEYNGLYFDGIQRNAFPSDTFRLTVSLTDNQNFAVAVACWLRTDQVGFAVFSRSQSLDRNTRRIVEEHVRELGFSDENNIFLSSDNCQQNQRPLEGGHGWRPQSYTNALTQNQRRGSRTRTHGEDTSTRRSSRRSEIQNTGPVTGNVIRPSPFV